MAMAYASLRLAPVSCAASAAALPGASSLRKQSDRAPQKLRIDAQGEGGAPPITKVISPRRKFASLGLRGKLSERSAIDRLVHLGELARHHRAALGTEGGRQIRKRAAMRCGASKKTSVRGSLASSSNAVRRSRERAGRKPSKQKRPVGKPATASAAVIAEGPGIERTSNPALAASLHELISRVGQERRARIAHERNHRARLELRQHLRHALRLVVGMQRQERPRYSDRAQQDESVAGILGCDEIRLGQARARAVAQIGEISDRRRNDVEPTR
jgi:hypothetical protein